MIRPYEVKYVNAQGAETNLSTPPYFWNETDLLNYEWGFTSVKNSIGYGSVIKNFSKSSKTYKLTLNVWNTDQSIIHTVLNSLHATFEKDLLSATPGKLYVGDQYISGYMVSCEKGEYVDKRFIRLNLTFVTGSPFWITEQLFSFATYTASAATGFKFPLAFPFQFAATQDTRELPNDHYAASNAIITFFGPCTNPQISIGSHIYLVSGALIAGERYEINQPLRTVTKITTSGDRLNVFNSRGKEYSVFEPIPAGENWLYYSGEFAVDVTLLKERSEPLWS